VPTPSDPELRSLANANDGRNLESTVLLSPSLRSHHDSILSEASEPPDFQQKRRKMHYLNNRGSISREMIREMFTGEDPVALQVVVEVLENHHNVLMDRAPPSKSWISNYGWRSSKRF
jgi:hypothetical protein